MFSVLFGRINQMAVWLILLFWVNTFVNVVHPINALLSYCHNDYGRVSSGFFMGESPEVLPFDTNSLLMIIANPFTIPSFIWKAIMNTG